MSGHKSTLFSIVIFLSFLFARNPVYRFRQISLFIITLLVVNFIFIHFDRFNLINDLLVRRFFFTSPHITNAFIEYYQNSPLYWSHSLLNFHTNFNEEHPTYILGSFLFGQDKIINANIGFIGDGFMNAGIIGFMLYSNIVTILILLVTKSHYKNSYLGIFVMMMLGLIEQELTVSIFTHGLLVLFIMCLIFLHKEKSTL
jgi:hypothetical protein